MPRLERNTRVADPHRSGAARAAPAAARTRTAIAAAAGCRAAARHRCAASLATSQLRDSRPMPISVPRMVARTTPTTATFSVLRMPISSAHAVGVDGRVVRDQRLADRDAGRAIEEAEAGGDVSRRQVAVGVGDQIPDDRDDEADDQRPARRCCETPGRTSSAARGGEAASSARPVSGRQSFPTCSARPSLAAATRDPCFMQVCLAALCGTPIGRSTSVAGTDKRSLRSGRAHQPVVLAPRRQLDRAVPQIGRGDQPRLRRQLARR